MARNDSESPANSIMPIFKLFPLTAVLLMVLFGLRPAVCAQESGQTDSKAARNSTARRWDRETWSWETFKAEEHQFSCRYPTGLLWRDPHLVIINGPSCSVEIERQCPDINAIFDAVQGNPPGTTDANRRQWKERGLDDQWSAQWETRAERVESSNVRYCLWVHSDAAAGSVFREYFVTTVRDNECFTVYFVVRTFNCGHFGPGMAEKCRRFQRSRLPEVINRMISSFYFSN